MQEAISCTPILQQSMQMLSRTLVELYEAAEHLAIGEYPHSIMQVLGRLIDFDGGMFGIVSRAPAIQRAHVYGRSAPFASDLVSMLEHDPIMRCWLHDGINTPIACDCERFYDERALFQQDRFYRRHRVARMLLFGDAPCCERNGQLIVLFRSSGDPFNEEERQYLMTLWPHIVRGVESNRRHCLEREVADHAGRAAALMSREGMIEAEDTAFRPALLEEWPQFSGRNVPDAVLECWGAGTAFVGKRIRISMSAQGEYILCHASRYGAPGALTQAERVVACQFASGLSHRRIAENLGVSQNTVRSHIAHVYEKLDIHDKAALANLLACWP